MAKTGSMALASAIGDAGFPDAIHLHYLGPRAIRLKRADPEPMLDLAIEIAGRIADPACDFRLVTSVRDPIARILSQAFYIAKRHREVHGVDIVRDPDALIAWWDATKRSRQEIWTEWFDDTFKATFGFDFREHPFDHERKSLRFDSDPLRLLVLRQEDERSRREAELGWLIDRPGVVLGSINDAAQQGYEAAYRAFVTSFVAPSHWLDAYYETEVIRHCYSEAERAAFRARWSGEASRVGSSPGQGNDIDPAAGDVGQGPSSQLASTGRPAAESPSGRTLLCLSMMKTGSTALTTALQEAGLGREPVHLHHLGPLARARLNPADRPVDAVARWLDEPDRRFDIVTSVREPVSRWISQAFHNASEVLARTGRDIVADADTFMAWIDGKALRDYSSEWFDDSLKATFGFDFRQHPFDHGRGSLRFESERLRLLILRQDDPLPLREAELGWLVGRSSVPIPRQNEAAGTPLADRYRAFLDSFVAPASWLDGFYETEVARHFYSDAERDAFRAHWSRPRGP